MILYYGTSDNFHYLFAICHWLNHIGWLKQLQGVLKLWEGWGQVLVWGEKYFPPTLVVFLEHIISVLCREYKTITSLAVVLCMIFS